MRVQNENTNEITGLCLSPADLIVSKLAAGREKDLAFVRALFKHNLVKPSQVEAVLPELDNKKADQIKWRLARCAQAPAI